MKYISILLLLFIFNSGFSQTTNFKIDSLNVAYKNAKHDTDKVNILNQLSMQYRIKANFDMAMKHSIQAQQLAESSNYKKGLLRSIISIGSINNYQGNYENAMQFFIKGLKMSEVFNDKMEISNSFLGIGNVYYYQGNQKDAIDNYLKSLKIKEDIQDEKGISAALRCLGGVYNSQHNYEKAINVFSKSLEIERKYGNRNNLATILNNLGAIYINQASVSQEVISIKFNEQALSLFLEALKINQETENKDITAKTYNNIGSVYSNLNRMDKALYYYLKSIEIKKEIGDKMGLADSYCNMGFFSLEQNKFKESEQYANQSLSLCKDIGYQEGVMQSYVLFAQLFEQKKDYKEALKYHKLFKSLNDSIFNAESSTQIADMNAKYESEKKQNEIDILTKDKELKETQLKQQKTIRYGLIALVAVLLLGIWWAVVYYKNKITSNKIIALKTEELSKQNALIDGQLKERQRIAKELHDGIGGTLAGIKLNLMSIDNDAKTELKPIINNLSLACKEVRTISHNLSSPILSNETSLIMAINNILQPYQSQTATAINFNYFNEEELNIAVSQSYKETLIRVIQELLHNAIKYASATKIDIHLSTEEQMLFLLVEDNGIGFDVNEKKDGIGLKNIKERIASVSGTIEFDSKLNRGTAVNIQIPTNNKI